MKWLLYCLVAILSLLAPAQAKTLVKVGAYEFPPYVQIQQQQASGLTVELISQLNQLQQQYHFICCSEAIEHFVNPAQEWALWLTLLKPGGTLAIMTKRYTTAAAFAGWHYKRDPTHVSFFSADTFAYLAERDGFTLNIADNDVVILQQRKH